ncbi:MAG: hypothetical protein ABI847_07855 [Anaerolineales bacterium]
MKFWIIVVATIAGILLSFLFASMANNGVFIEWRPLPHPPERAAKIRGAEPFGQVIIETAGGNYYSCDQFLRTPICWSKTVWPQELKTDPYLHECVNNHFRTPQPPGIVTDQVEVKACLQEGMFQRNYAILDDGSVWEWGNTSNANLLVFYLFFVGPAVGFLVGVIIAITVHFVQKSKSAKANTQGF